MPRLVSDHPDGGTPVHDLVSGNAKKEAGDSVSTGTGGSDRSCSGTKDEEATSTHYDSPAAMTKPSLALAFGQSPSSFTYASQLRSAYSFAGEPLPRSAFGPASACDAGEDRPCWGSLAGAYAAAKQAYGGGARVACPQPNLAPGTSFLAEVALRAHENYLRDSQPVPAPRPAPGPEDFARDTWYPDRTCWEPHRRGAVGLDELAAGVQRRQADQWIYAKTRPHTPPPLLANQSVKWRSLVLPVLSSKVTVGDIRKLFQEYAVKSVKVVQGRRTGFVNFGTHEDAACALLQAQRGELVLGGQRLHAAWAKRNADSTRVRLGRRAGGDEDSE